MRLITILNLLSLLFTPIPKTNYSQSVSTNAQEFVLMGYDDYFYNSSYQLFNQYIEDYVDYSYYNNNTLQYSYMVYPYSLSSDTYDVYTIFTDFVYLFSIEDIHDILIDGHFFELQLFYLDNIPFTNSTDTLNFFKSIDNMGFDYYLNYDNNTYSGLIPGDTIHSYITFDNYINSESNLFIIMRISNVYYDYLLDSDLFLRSGTYYTYLGTNNGFNPFTAWYNPMIKLSNLQVGNQGYTTGFNDGVNSVDTDIYYQQGVDSVNTGAIYANAYNAGYNAGLTESSHDYGISNLLFSIFDIPITIMSSLFSFTIFGTEVWGLLISLMFVAFILLVTAKILGRSSD